MSEQYSVSVCTALEKKFRDAGLHRPMRISHFDAGTELSYTMDPVTVPPCPDRPVVRLLVERFVGGGFAGQVYRVKVLSVEQGSLPGVAPGSVCAMKILIPPSGFAVLFRNALYFIGFQGPFQQQCNPAAARAGALWQKFIRRAAALRFGDEGAVNDVHATFVDTTLGSCGELSDWIDGRTWRLEVDEHMDVLRQWRQGRKVDAEKLGSPEYRSKKQFMDTFVRLLHDMGGYEFARQYEWSTCMSQPNCLKRTATDDTPEAGLVAVDFRAGLTLLPFLPMSPGDFKLIARGIARGSLVQFDRGDVAKLESFVTDNAAAFKDMTGLLEDLKAAETIYRDSIPDITHNHVRLLYSRKLWSTLFSSAVTGWKVRKKIDSHREPGFRNSTAAVLLFFLLGCIPLLGKVLQRVWARDDWRRHYAALLKSPGYLKRALRGRMAEALVGWHRAGRVDPDDALRVSDSLPLFILHLSLSWMPAGLHKFLTNWQYARERLLYYLVRPVRLYFDALLREQWLRDMVQEGRNKHIITPEDADEILSQIKEPFIQKYLKSLAVHVCTLPVTQVVSVILAVAYVVLHPEMPRAQAWAVGLGIIALFQVIPVSPGSLTRGLYVLYLVIRERNFKDYNIAVFLGFFKYIGYLAFPIQMAYRYPTLARFMAVHWATDAVPIVPVFGERGALLEHSVFCLFYNWPLTIRRRVRKQETRWKSLRPRYRHVPLLALLAAGVFGIADAAYLNTAGTLPSLRDIGWLAALVPVVLGAVIMPGCGGASLARRIIAASAGGAAAGICYTAITALLGNVSPAAMLTECAWRVFVFTLLSTAGSLLAVLRLKDPDME